MKDPNKLTRLRELAGLPTPEYTTYYNLGGPDKNCAVGRIDGDDVFVVEMNRTGYDNIIQENNPKKAYSVLYKIYTENPEVEATKKLNLLESLLED